MSSIKNTLYQMRKRINDKDLLKIKSIIDNEIERRSLNDTNASQLQGG